MRRLTLVPTLLIWASIVAITAILLNAAGRQWICPCGTIQFVELQRMVGQESQQFLDIYSLTHILHGLLFYFLVWLVGRGRIPFLWGLLIAAVIEGGWELFENSQFLIKRYQDQTVSQTYQGDSVLNSIGDIIVMSVGFILASRIPVWASVALFILVEVSLAYFIRDSLILNIIGLTYPIEWISKWQEGGGSP